jgi:hypothetical protein
VFTDNGIGARSVHNTELREEFHRKGKKDLTLTDDSPLLLLTMAKEVYFCGGGGHPFFQQSLTQEGINHSTLPSIEFSHDHNEKEFIELLDGLLKRLLIFSFNPEAPQCQLEVIHEPPFILE